MIVLFMMFFIGQAQAQLQSPPTTIAFPPQPTLPKEVSCADLVAHIKAWGDFRTEADIAVAGFGEQLGNAVDSWVNLLKPLEGKTTEIKAGFFAPVQAGSEALQDNVPMIYVNSSFFDEHLKKVILPTLEKCLKEKQ